MSVPGLPSPQEGDPGPAAKSGRALAIALLVFIVLLVACWLATRWYEGQLLSEYKAQAAVRASLRGNALSLAIGRRIALLQGLSAFVQVQSDAPDFGERFEILAAELYAAAGARGVRNIAAAPGSIVRYVYPLEGNETVLGHAPLQDTREEIRRDAERAVLSREIALSGPTELLQGGLGLIAQQAIYVGQNRGAGTYWGLVSMVIELAPLYDEVELDVQTDITLDYALRDSRGQVFYGTPTVFDQDPVIHLVELPEGAWELAGIPQEGWYEAVRRPLLIAQIAGLIICALLAGLTYVVIRRQTELAEAFARQKRINEENARLYQQSQRLAVLEERQRIARELHDSVSQALYGIGLGARTARKLLDRDPAKAVEPTEYVLSLAEAGLAEMRAMIFELRPDSLEKEGLVSALLKQATALGARYDLEVETTLADEPELPFEFKEALYRVAQEAMNNVAKHAQARKVAVRLDRLPSEIALTVCDDGIGFDPGGEYPGHVGLRSMRERVERLGGRLQIDSVPEEGTQLRASVPLPAAQRPNPG